MHTMRNLFSQHGLTILASWLLPFVLVALAVAMLLSRHHVLPHLFDHWVQPKQAYDITTRIAFDPGVREASVATYLPESNHRQSVLRSAISAPHMQQTIQSSANGLLSRWQGGAPANTIEFSHTVAISGVSYDIPPSLKIDQSSSIEWQHYLRETDVIPVKHPEIEAAWQQIQPQNQENVLDAISAIYTLTSKLPTLPFKGTTDSLTALRLGAASCNGKSRLFVSLARHIGLPARLVGGVVLTQGSKKTSHQWVEVNIQDQWVPFDPTNKYFAQLPSHYLALYWGDKGLFTRSANIAFDYQFDIKRTTLAPALQAQFGSDSRDDLTYSLAQPMIDLGLTPQTSAIFLLLPLCTLLISVLRNVVGIASFGTFMPMLIASACAVMGLNVGLLGFVFILALATIGSVLLNRLRLLKIPRLAILVTLVNLASLTLLYQFKQFTPLEIGMMSLFPVIIISFIADSLNELIEERQWLTLLNECIGTLVSIIVCYLAIQSPLLQGLFAVYPELYLVVLAGLIHIGGWTGLKLSELMRFKDVIKANGNVLGINARNTLWVAKHNKPGALRDATDKLATKRLLESHGIPTPSTLAVFERLPTLSDVHHALFGLTSFVLKPNRGSQGKGIVVIKEKVGDDYVSMGGKHWSVPTIQQQINETVCGRFSQDKADIAYIEPRIEQHPSLQSLAPNGLADIRVIVLEKRILCAMLRLPTLQSDGKANLHQGAIGASVGLQTGTITRAKLKRHLVTHHPDTGHDLIGFEVPHWERVIAIAQQCADTNDLGYMGIDICIDANQGPLVLEVNGRPGLEVQNVQNTSLNDLANPNLQLKTI